MKPVSHNQGNHHFNFKAGTESKRPETNPQNEYAHVIKSAWLQAEKDIEEDPYFHLHLLTHDLDEGETARLGS